jgi:hypothetical protein
MLDFVLHVTFQQLSAFETSTGIYLRHPYIIRDVFWNSFTNTAKI